MSDKNKKSNRKLVSTKTYTITEKTYDNGDNELTRVNDGFSAVYLLGLLEWTQKDILKQMEGHINPDIINRIVIKDKDNS